jgi:hypothetical protein
MLSKLYGGSVRLRSDTEPGGEPLAEPPHGSQPIPPSTGTGGYERRVETGERP